MKPADESGAPNGLVGVADVAAGAKLKGEPDTEPKGEGADVAADEVAGKGVCVGDVMVMADVDGAVDAVELLLLVVLLFPKPPNDPNG